MSGARPLAVRGEVWLVALDPTMGSEIQKTRPCVVLSPDELNRPLPTLVAAPMTTGSHPAPFRIAVRFRRQDGLILLDQLRTLDRQRLVRRLGTIEPATLLLALSRLRSLFAE